MRKFLWIVIGLAALGAVTWKMLPMMAVVAPSVIPPPYIKAPEPDAPAYRALCEDIEKKRLALATRYRQARTGKEREEIEAEARGTLETTLPAMMRCWLGTPWDFNGTATTPGGGKIACGYFVATILRDGGFRVERAKLAQQASQNIIKTFIDAKSWRLTVGQPYDAFAAGVRAAEPGISVVGLDSHVAFLVNDSKDFHMIHSSGASPWRVVDEDSAAAEVLKRSNYRVVGHLTADRSVIRRWLSGDPIPVKIQGT